MENTTNNTKTDSLFIRISEEDKAALMTTAERLDVPFSQIVRVAIRKEVELLNAAAPETTAATV
jgi:hypothetical protein